MLQWRRRAILTAQKEVVTFRWYRQRPGGLGVLCSDGCNQCSDAKGWVLDTGCGFLRLQIGGMRVGTKKLSRAAEEWRIGS